MADTLTQVRPYAVLARKWRPTQFGEIVGQAHVVRTLSNAIAQERIHQAYLFTGSRGIGKTSIARIFARALRCEQREAPTTERAWLKSCGECSDCREISAGNSVDVLEIDGASNNGVDAVREIRDQAKYLPTHGARKIYIIDEVHMLTTAAFNALLKTLEEPPPHVVFVFATTEPHKIPATILSRCQRFDFKRATQAQLEELLKRVARAEGLEIDDAAVSLLARAAEGGMRDALSLLDQSIAFGGTRLNAEQIRDAVGLLGLELVMGVGAALTERNTAEAIRLVSRAYDDGHDLRMLARSLLELFHALLLSKNGVTAADASLTAFSTEEWQRIEALAGRATREELEYGFQLFHQGIEWIARSPSPKAIFDILILRCVGASREGSEIGLPRGGETKTPPSPLPTQASVASPTAAPVPTAAPLMMAAGAPVTPAEPVGARSWEGFIAFVKQSRKLLGSILEHGRAEPSAPGRLEIAFASDHRYYREQLTSKAYSAQLQTLADQYYGQPTRVVIAEVSEASAQFGSVAAQREQERQVKQANAEDAVRNHPLISEARSLFGGTLGTIEIL